MKSRLTLIFAALVVLLGSMVWLVQDRIALADAPVGVPVPLMSSTSPAPLGRVVVLPVAPAAEHAAVGTARPVADPAAAARPSAVPTAALRETKSVATVGIDDSGAVTYVARDGDTVSELANALRGGGSRDDRDAVIAANPSLRSDPDRVLTGQTYSIDVPTSAGATRVTTDPQPEPAAATTPVARSGDDAPRLLGTTEAQGQAKTTVVGEGPRLTYTAQLGDTVRVLAAQLLGGDTKANRNAIIAGNASLRQEPHHLVTGQRYTIPARNGLSVDPAAPPVAGPITQPNADDVIRVGAGRTLGYAARRGDTVSKLAATLLGSDTQANRQAIINNNPGLQQDPDHLVVGQTYWITAPMADSLP